MALHQMFFSSLEEYTVDVRGNLIIVVRILLNKTKFKQVQWEDLLRIPKQHWQNSEQ